MNLLDLLSVLRELPLSGEGSFKEAVQVIRGSEEYFMHRRFLEGLGHARVDWESRRIHALSPRLVALPREDEHLCSVVLAGARSTDLLNELSCLASNGGVKMDRMPLGQGLPDRVTLRGNSCALKEVASKCRSMAVEISDDPTTPDAWRLLSKVKDVREVIRDLIQEKINTSQGEPPAMAKMFNPETGYFDRWSILSQDYPSYYALWMKESYVYRFFWRTAGENEEAGGGWIQSLSSFSLESFWARWAVAYSTDPDSALPKLSGHGCYKVPKRTPLPTELHRVCCLCSGLPPDECHDFYTYRNIPPVIQQGVNDRLMVDNP